MEPRINEILTVQENALAHVNVLLLRIRDSNTYPEGHEDLEGAMRVLNKAIDSCAKLKHYFEQE